ncbi:disco-interacting protein 2-like protein [Sarcoptes scabiei]|uniref:Disco-interacting protein 2-like protein n=1 Tax=Sarcoptes scabiei TaxID=52283 RepID=A0A132A6X0_SARSC|nr:disco-interacting protein 2-like protein [Sarcoptes scabiei]
MQSANMTPTIDNLNLLISSKVNLIDNILLEDNYNESIYSGLSLIERPASPSTRAKRRAHRRVTRHESRYHSEIRQEAVQQALAAMQNKTKPSIPMPSKRTSVMATSPKHIEYRRDRLVGTDSSSDDDSILNESSSTASERDKTRRNYRQSFSIDQSLPNSSDTSTHSSPAHERNYRHDRYSNIPQRQQQQKQQPVNLPRIVGLHEHSNSKNLGFNTPNNSGKIAMNPNRKSHIQSQPLPPPPTLFKNPSPIPGLDLNQNQISKHQSSNRFNDDYEIDTGTCTTKWKVSNKIQQLLNTLKKPKRRPLPDFYVDDETDLEIAANQVDPSAPKPEGNTMLPSIGEQLMVPPGLPKTLESALQRYGTSTFKAPAITVLDTNGKIAPVLTYGKLYNRSRKIAYSLLNKIGQKGELNIKTSDRVALVYPNNDPIGFACSFFGCLTAGVIPVPIEVPLSRRDAGSQQIGFLLGSCNVSYALTSEACFKGLPKTTTGEIHTFKGWPKINWLITDNLTKPPKEWQPPSRISEESSAYIEYTSDKDGSVKGVCISRTAMISHCRALTGACNYSEGEVMVCVLDFKREVGLWHAIQTSILNGMHVIFIPYSLMKVNPAMWLLMITKFKASIAVCKSRDLHWGILANKDHKDINLSSLRMLLVADGANPWSLSSCDQFFSVFHSRGLRVEAMCPCATSPEALTISIRRPGRTGVGATGRGVLSMSALSYGVIRVDNENSLTSLTLQDCGHVLPGIGEICLSTTSSGSCYLGLNGLTNNIFKMQPFNSDGRPFSEQTFVRTGLLGFMGPGALVFVCGTRDGVMQVTGRKHNTDDLIATVLAVEPMKFVYRGRIAIFSIKVLRDERICIVAEQRPECTEDESFQWMSRVIQAVDSIHQVGIYCLALIPPNCLSKTPLGGIHLAEVKRKFIEGSLHPVNVLMCPHTCVTNLPKPREIHSEIGPASVMVGNIVQGVRLAVAQGRDIGSVDEEGDFRKQNFITEVLKSRATNSPDHILFTLLNSKNIETASLSCSQLYKRAERIACLLIDRGKPNTGDHVALIYSPGIDLICAFYGCLMIGVVPVTIRPPHPQNLKTTLLTVQMIANVSKASLILSTAPVIKLLKSKEANSVVEIKSWPLMLDTDDCPKRKLNHNYKAPTPEMMAYLDFSVSTTGMLAGIKVSHAGLTSLCRSMKIACELYASRHIALCLDPYCGLGFVLWCINSVYSGHHTILIPPSEVELNPEVWLTAVSQYKVRDTFCSYGVMELCTKDLGSSIQQLKQRGINLSCVRTCVIVAEERPRVALTTSFTKLFHSLGLSSRSVSTSFGCRSNIALCLQGASSPDPTTVYVDTRALRNDRVTLVERGAPHSICLMESGKLLPGTKVIIANPETKGHCGDSNLGEIWVQSPHNSSGFFAVFGDENLHNEHFNARLSTGDTSQTYARTGFLGFLRRTESVQADGELHDAVFVVGSLDETITLRGLRYHPIDIENSVMRSHKKISECAVFTWSNLLVVVAELDGNENEALDLVPMVTNIILEEHHLIVGVVVVVDPGVVPINSRGEKQRMHLRDGFLADQLDPIYVAYNM